MNNKRNTRVLAVAAFSALAAFLVYAPSLWHGFVNWDDPVYVLENPYIRSLDGPSVRFMLTSFYSANWHPLTLFSYALDYAIWGKDPFGYHLTNNVLHALNTGIAALLAFRVASLAGIKAPLLAAAVTAALFGLHPVHVESVAWVSERKDLLCAFFFLLAALSYLRYATASSRGWYLASLALFALSLASKPMAVTFPVVLLILDLFPLGRLKDRPVMALLEKAPFFALSAASSVLTLLAQRSGGAIVPIEIYPLWMRIAGAIRALGFYVFKAVFPSGLAPFYPMPGRSEVFDAYFYGAAALIAATILISIMSFRRFRGFSAAWLYFLAMLIPVIGLVQVGSQAAADRYTYLPLIGPFILSGAGLSFLLGILKARRAAYSAALAACVCVAIALASLTVRQAGFWRDSLTLWDRQLELYPGKLAHIYNLRGLAYDEKKMFREAIADFDYSIALKPSYAFAFNNRGNAYKSLGEFGNAIEDFKAAARLAPGLPEPYINLSAAYSEIGEMELAFAASKRAGELGWGRRQGR
ncbi:MAG: tetratricopeptide repeat protein [Candidatus Methylomirabilis sp.]|nr:tetratricopeptide repeat protein [Deltaproteobacteria bacterium]